MRIRLVIAILLTTFCLSGMAVPVGAQDLANMVRAVKQAQDNNSLFGSIEIRSDTLRGLQQWQRVVGAMKTAGPAFAACARSAANCNTAMLKRWREIVAAANALPYKERMKAVNTAFNRWPYKLDIEVYGVREYWATPKEFIIRSGDCEDYSIAKYYALRYVGYSKDELRIVAVRDTIRGYGHAIMAVYVGKEILILDNLSPLVLSHRKFTHYNPQVSMNETSRWAHVSNQAQRQKAAVKSRSQGLSASNLFR
jgi:predicted transglutaminase-like cysteine proteinase